MLIAGDKVKLPTWQGKQKGQQGRKAILDPPANGAGWKGLNHIEMIMFKNTAFRKKGVGPERR